MTSQPYDIFQFIQLIDDDPRRMTEEEITELTEPKNGGKGDWFAQWLAQTPPSDRQLSFRGLLTKTDCAKSYKAFAVADGTPIVYDHENPDNPLNSVSRSLRFVVACLPDSNQGDVPDLSLRKRTLLIVASSNFDGTGAGAFLQCASWDPDAVAKGKGLFRFYQRDPSDGWVFFGDSFNAFNPKSVNYGPFDGHVGGALIMKELKRPWAHWFTASNMADFKDSLGSTRETPSKCDPHNALYDGLFTSPYGNPFNKITTAELLENLISVSVDKWYASRYYHNFVDSSSKTGHPHGPNALKDWMGHILISNAMNIAVSSTSTAQIKQQAPVSAFPITLFVNSHALQAVLPNVGNEVQWDFHVKNADYVEAVSRLKLSLYYDDFKTNTRKIAVADSEGPFAFPIIEPGIEDYQAVRTLANSSVQILPKKAIAAMLMIDFYNPMYSAKRAKLMAYLPDTITFNTVSNTYDFLDQFIANVRASDESKDENTPEYEILKNLELDDDQWVSIFTQRVNAYLGKVEARLKGDTQEDAVVDYMILAEGRRRLFKGWEDSRPEGSGLDEFRMTLPIAASPDPFPLSEMTESGHITTLGFTEGTIPRAVACAGYSRFKAGTGGCPAYARVAEARLKCHK